MEVVKLKECCLLRRSIKVHERLLGIDNWMAEAPAVGIAKLGDFVYNPLSVNFISIDCAHRCVLQHLWCKFSYDLCIVQRHHGCTHRWSPEER
jgi:hypothetical protein